MKKKLFVWDFHGVLEKGNDLAVLEISNLVLQEFGYAKKLTIKEAEKLSGKHWYEYFSYLLPEEDLAMHLKLQQRCFEISHTNLQIVQKYLQANDGAKKVLEKIKKANHHQIIISNTTQKALKNHIQLIGIDNYFPKGTYFGIDKHAKKEQSKKNILKQFLQKNPFQTLITIGDSPADIALATLLKNGVSYLYTYPYRLHRNTASDYKIHFLEKVLQEV